MYTADLKVASDMGQCMYTGEKIDLSQLNDATIWDRDHIYPQSKTKDDSLDKFLMINISHHNILVSIFCMMIIIQITYFYII